MDLKGYVMSIIALLISIISILVSIIMGIVANIVSKNIAKKYGDLAGSEAAIDYAEEKATEARKTTLIALRNEVARIRKLASQIEDTKWIVRMPTTTFETAFISNLFSLSVNPELFNVVLDYLICADVINMQIEIYLGFGATSGSPTPIVGGTATGAKKLAKDKSKAIPEILDRLDKLLQRELGMS